MSQEIAAVLRRAAELIAEPERWTRETLARDANGKECQEYGPEAVQWCAMGAIVRAAQTGYSPGFWQEAVYALRRHLRVGNVGAWNDAPYRTHAEVVAALLGAADAAERGAKGEGVCDV